MGWLPENLRGPLKWAGYASFGFLVLLLSFYVTLPRDRIQDRVESAASEWLNADVAAQDFGLTLLPGITASGVTIKMRPGQPQAEKAEKPPLYTIDDVTIHVG